MAPGGYLSIRAEIFDPIHAALLRKQNGCFSQKKMQPSPPQEAEPELFSTLIYTRNKLLFEVGKLFLRPQFEFLI